MSKSIHTVDNTDTGLYKNIHAGILDSAVKLAEKTLKPENTFAVRCKKRGKLVKSSIEVEKAVGKAITQSTGAKVDLENPQYIMVVEVVGRNTGICLKPVRRT